MQMKKNYLVLILSIFLLNRCTTPFFYSNFSKSQIENMNNLEYNLNQIDIQGRKQGFWIEKEKNKIRDYEHKTNIYYK
jgi:hypothetical protein